MSAARRSLTIADLRMEMVARVAAGAALLVVIASFAYSFSAMKWVSDQLGADPEALSYAFPFIIDLPALVASALTVALHDRALHVRRYAWSVLILFTTLSWVCNAIHAAAHSTINQTIPEPWGTIVVVLIAGFPPLGVVLGMHLWAFALRHSASADMRADGKATPVQRAPQQRAPQPAQVRTAERAPAPAASAQMSAHQGAQERAYEPARGTVAPLVRDALQARAREVYERMRDELPGMKPDAAAIHREIESPKNVATTRRWVQAWWEDDEAAAGAESPTESPDAAADARVEELHIADPETADPVTLQAAADAEMERPGARAVG